ncbi:MAG: DoxX family protein [Bdellovibrionales bacterium]|nr:DoxX family protein [Bdellovibrionales bacterium]
MVKSSVVKFIASLESLQSIPILIIRIGLGWLFFWSGWGKLNNLPKIIDYFQSLGIPAPSVQAPFVALVEFLGGIAVFLGLGARLASLLLASTMIVALITAKREDIADFASLWDISEFLYVLFFLVIATHGPGKFALEGFLHKRWKV